MDFPFGEHEKTTNKRRNGHIKTGSMQHVVALMRASE